MSCASPLSCRALGLWLSPRSVSVGSGRRRCSGVRRRCPETVPLETDRGYKKYSPRRGPAGGGGAGARSGGFEDVPTSVDPAALGIAVRRGARIRLPSVRRAISRARRQHPSIILSHQKSLVFTVRRTRLHAALHLATSNMVGTSFALYSNSARIYLYLSSVPIRDRYQNFENYTDRPDGADTHSTAYDTPSIRRETQLRGPIPGSWMVGNGPAVGSAVRSGSPVATTSVQSDETSSGGPATGPNVIHERRLHHRR
jgi:hypothetical protein